MKKLMFAALVSLLFVIAGCGEYTPPAPSSDEVQQRQQEQVLKEGTAQTGMPAIKNFREKKLLKDIL